MLLVDRGDPGGLRQTDLAAVGGELAQDQFEQGGLPHAVAADQADLGPDRKRDSRRIEEATAPAVEYEIVDREHDEGAENGGKGRRGAAKGPFLNPVAHGMTRTNGQSMAMRR